MAECQINWINPGSFAQVPKFVKLRRELSVVRPGTTQNLRRTVYQHEIFTRCPTFATSNLPKNLRKDQSHSGKNGGILKFLIGVIRKN